MSLGNLLHQLIATHGRDLLRERHRVLGLLADRLPGQEGERDRWLMEVAYRAGVVESLLQSGADHTRWRAIQRLTVQFSLDPGRAELIVGLLSQILGHGAGGFAPTPPRKADAPAALPPVEAGVPDLHGWPPERVQVLQQRAAAELGLGLMLQDPLASGGLGPEMLVIPAGSFLMGSPPDEPERFDNEGPQHRVTLAQPFALGRYAVTFAEYDRHALASGRPPPGDSGWGRGRRPVIQVSWDDAQAYCQWLSVQTGQRYRLPSEAEWEYACRAGAATPFHWGRGIHPGQANYDGGDSYNGGPTGEFRGRTLPVDQFAPNAFGLYQMHGNVWEWCQDCWHDHYQGAPTDGSPWLRGNCALRVVHGGSWKFFARDLRSALRFGMDTGHRDDNLGFRVVRELRDREGG